MTRTYVYVTELPNCDLCPLTFKSKAKYDGRTRFGPWAYMCERHFQNAGIGLGTGKGQRLLLEGEKP